MLKNKYEIKSVFCIALFAVGSVSAQKSNNKEVLLVGVFHFNNPGHDLAKTETFDVMSDQSQRELDFITDKIRAFAPDKIFVEWPYKEQEALDTLYDLYKKGSYFNYVQKKYPKSNFYTQNEIFQLAFRAGKKAGVQRIYAVDYQMDFPFDSLRAAMQKAGQIELRKTIDEKIRELGKRDNALRRQLTLTQLLLEVNKNTSRAENLGLYLGYLNRGGALHDFTGPEVVNAWYRRNLYMYSLIQKMTEDKDRRVVVIIGSGHAAVMKHYIETDGQFKVVELSDLIKRY